MLLLLTTQEDRWTDFKSQRILVGRASFASSMKCNLETRADPFTRFRPALICKHLLRNMSCRCDRECPSPGVGNELAGFP